MNKENKIEVPSMEVEPKPEKRKPGRPKKAVETELSTCGVSFPMHEGELGYCARRIDVELTPRQARNMKRILIGLQRKGVLRGPRKEPIKNGGDVVRYLLDQFPEVPQA